MLCHFRSSFPLACLAAASTFAAPTDVLDLPPRPADAMTGSEFYQHLLPLSQSQREQAIITEIATGNVPEFLRQLKPVAATASFGGFTWEAVYYVAPDYVAVGSDEDFFRLPMSAPLAQQVADIAGCVLPTRKMVDAIYQAAPVKLAPRFFSPSTYNINSLEVFWLSNEEIDGQLAGQQPGPIVGGTKKDIVVTPQLSQRPAPPRVAIYGWHQLNGSPIQPLSLVHSADYHDYSHGVRLVGEVMLINGDEITVPAAIASSATAALLSDEGAFTETRYPIPNPYPLPGEEPLIVNGNFEADYPGGVASGWSAFTQPASGALVFGRASINRYDGAHSQYWARTDTAPFDGGIYQQVPVEPGNRYELRAWMKRQSTFTGTFLQVGLDPTGGTNPAATSVHDVSLDGADNTWIEGKISVTAQGETMTVFLRGGHTGTTGDDNAYFYADAANLTDLGPDVDDTWMIGAGP